MNTTSFSKILTANDIGKTGSHQAGLHIPKTNQELLDFLPTLDGTVLNPSVWITCADEHGEIWKFRFVYYNNKFHSVNGCRNEFRLTHTTRYLKQNAAFEGDTFIISREFGTSTFKIKLIPQEPSNLQNPVAKVILTGWHREY
jgi:hypothetical protein